MPVVIFEMTSAGFYRLDIGEKLLVPDELAEALKQEIEAKQQAELQLEQERQRAEDLASLLKCYRDRFGELPEI